MFHGNKSLKKLYSTSKTSSTVIADAHERRSRLIASHTEWRRSDSAPPTVAPKVSSRRFKESLVSRPIQRSAPTDDTSKQRKVVEEIEVHPFRKSSRTTSVTLEKAIDKNSNRVKPSFLVNKQSSDTPEGEREEAMTDVDESLDFKEGTSEHSSSRPSLPAPRPPQRRRSRSERLLRDTVDTHPLRKASSARTFQETSDNSSTPFRRSNTDTSSSSTFSRFLRRPLNIKRIATFGMCNKCKKPNVEEQSKCEEESRSCSIDFSDRHKRVNAYF